MKIKKMLFYIFVVLSIFVIYKITFKYNINYVALGDSLSLGINSYGEEVYGYSDYIKDYLNQTNKLGEYTNKFSRVGQKIENLIDDINNDRTIAENEKYYHIKRSLREADLITISIGVDDFKEGLSIDSFVDGLSDINKLKKRIDEICIDYEQLLKLVKKYSKGDIVVIGFYNPFPHMNSYKKEIDELVKYTNKKFQQICGKNKVYFVDIFDYFVDRTDYLPNPFNINPTVLGYNEIFKQVKKVLDNKIIKD